MLIELTSSFDPGDVADDGPYTHVQIRSFGVDMVGEKIAIETLLGTLDVTTFVAGLAIRNVTSKRFVASDSDFATLIAVDDNDLVEELYLWLVSEAHFVGTVIDETA